MIEHIQIAPSSRGVLVHRLTKEIDGFSSTQHSDINTGITWQVEDSEGVISRRK